MKPSQLQKMEICEEDGILIKGTKRIGKTKSVEVNLFRGNVYIHITNITNKKSVTLTLDEFNSVVGLQDSIQDISYQLIIEVGIVQSIC